jgi:hypothetical protein
LAQILPKAGDQLLWSDLDPRWPRTSLRIGWNGASIGEILFSAWTSNRPLRFLGVDDPSKLLDRISADPKLLGVVTYNTLLEAQARGVPVSLVWFFLAGVKPCHPLWVVGDPLGD